MEQAVLIYVGNSSDVDFGLDLLEDPILALEGSRVGELDGNEIGPDGAVLYLYGPDADTPMSFSASFERRWPVPPCPLAPTR